MNTHDFRIDRLRLLACFGVVLLHSSAGYGFDDLALNALFRFSVPVFVLISGWFQLDSPIPPAKLARKNALLLWKLLLWSGLYLVTQWVLWGIRTENVVTWLLTEPFHMWYLYALMGLNLLTPILYPFVRSARREEYLYALTVFFLLGCVVVTLVRMELVPVLEVILNKSKLPDMVGFVFMYLLGGWFRRYGFGNRKVWIAVGVVCSLFGMIAAQTHYDQHLASFLAPNVVLSGAACFVVYMTRKAPSERFQPLLRRAAECTMGVYLIHPFISNVVTPRLEPVRGILFPSAFMILRCGCIFIISFGIIWVLTLWKPLKKYAL